MRAAAQPRPIVVFDGVEISRRWQRADREPRRGSVEISPPCASSAAASPGGPGQGGCRLSFPTPSDGPTPDHNRVPAAGLGRKRVRLMGTKDRQLDWETSGRAMDAAVGGGAAASAPGREPSVRARAGRILRHWTTNGLASTGKATTTASGAGDWGLADGRQRNLVASKLRSFASGTGSP